MSPVLQALLAMPPVRLPGVTVFLISGSHVDTLMPRLEGYLDDDDKVRLSRMTHVDLRHRFIKGRAALRSVLTAFADEPVSETAWRFSASANSKPFVVAPKSSVASFNLSYGKPALTHRPQQVDQISLEKLKQNQRDRASTAYSSACADALAIAVSGTLEVGVDLEAEHPFPKDELPWHLFADDEQRLLRATPDKGFWRLFFRLWTLKEAIAKQTGQGFATEFSDINTTELPVVEGLNIPADRAEDETLLVHTRLPCLDRALHLAVSTGPIA